MYITQVFELSMVLDNEKFQKVLTKVCSRSNCLIKSEEGYMDESLASKGILVIYRDSQYKKRVKLMVNPRLILDNDAFGPDRLIHKLDKRVGEYFGSRYG